MPTFGSSTIRWFATNASEMKKLAVCNFENLLQVISIIFGEKFEFKFFFSAVSQHFKDCSRAIQYNYHDIFIPKSKMTCICKTSATYQEYSTASQTAYNGAWAVNVETTQSTFVMFELPEARNRHQKSGKRRRKQQHLRRNSKFWTSSYINNMRLGTMLILSVSLIQQMGSKPKSLVMFPHVGLFTVSVQQDELTHKIVKHFTDQQTSTMLNTKLLSVIKGLKGPIWQVASQTYQTENGNSKRQSARWWPGAEILYLFIEKSPSGYLRHPLQ